MLDPSADKPITARLRNQVHILDLIAQSVAYRLAGLGPEAQLLLGQADALDLAYTRVVLGGIKAGVIPEPGTPDWFTYVSPRRAMVRDGVVTLPLAAAGIEERRALFDAIAANVTDLNGVNVHGAVQAILDEGFRQGPRPEVVR